MVALDMVKRLVLFIATSAEAAATITFGLSSAGSNLVSCLFS